MAHAGEVTIKVKPDLSAVQKANPEEVTAVLAEHVYGDRGPAAGHPDALSVCTRAAIDLCDRFYILPRT
jgi:hypothetical protein